MGHLNRPRLFSEPEYASARAALNGLSFFVLEFDGFPNAGYDIEQSRDYRRRQHAHGHGDELGFNGRARPFVDQQTAKISQPFVHVGPITGYVRLRDSEAST